MPRFKLSFLSEALGGAAAGAVALGLAISPAQAHAQDSVTQDSVEGVVVAPYGAHAHADGHDGRANIGGPIEERPYAVSSSRLVRYGDLDLRSRDGAYLLKARLQDAARSACNQLGARWRAEDEDSAYCVADAVRDGMQQVSYDIGYTPRGW